MKGYVVLTAASAMVAGFLPSSRTNEITYGNRIEPMFRQNCTICHHKNGSAPFDFTTYEGIKSRIDLVRTQLLSKNMPPVWVHSDYGQAAIVSQLNDQDALDFQAWVQQGMQRGTVLKLPPRQTIVDPPTNVFRVGSQPKVRAEGIPYWSVQTVNLPRKGGEFDRFTLAPEHALSVASVQVAIVPKTMKLPKETVGSMDINPKYLVGTWSPGYRDWSLPNGMARKYPANSKLVLQILYKPAGKAESGAMRVELFRRQEKKLSSPHWVSFEQNPLIIPAGESKVVELHYPVQSDTSLISALPEARFYAGKVELIYTDISGLKKSVFEISRWDPFWVGNYMLEKPIRLPGKGVLTARFHYNNDANCRINEKKKLRDVRNGPTASDEVCRMHLLVGP